MYIELDQINTAVRQMPADFIRQTNAAYQTQLREIAQDIAKNREQRPIILLSGPSGSGKTTSALMLGKILDAWGIVTHTLSLDNYFTPFTPEERRLFAEGRLDLESPQRVDKAFLTEQLTAIYNCEPVDLPLYDFKDSRRLSTGRILHRQEGELVILEGIHSLNPAVIGFPDENTAKVYVSVRTRITRGAQALHPSKLRLMRRMIRDLLYRKRSFTDTLQMYHSVEAGENKYIMPYKYRSTYDVDTFMDYEISAYQPFLLEALRSLPEDDVTADMIAFLTETAPLEKSQVTPDSLICEFIGNGQFAY